MNPEVYIEFDKVSKSYGNLKALDELSFTVLKGDIYGFLGPNGSGKSTSIRILLSLIRPDSGIIRLFGKDLSYHRYQTLSRIGALIEKPDFYRYLSARKNLEILARLSKVAHISKKVDEVLELVGLSHRANDKVKTFSQGMKQRLGIAQTLLHEPDVIVLDEPLNGLDPQGQMEIREMIRMLNTEKGITLLMSSHLLNEIELVCNRMVIINKGKKIIEGDVRQLLQSGELKVSVTLDMNEDTLKVISASGWINYFKGHEENNLFFELNQDEIPALVSYLVSQNIKVYSVKPVRTLEEYFIKLTAND